MSKKRNNSANVKAEEAKREAKIAARQAAQQAEKKKQMQQILIWGGAALAFLIVLTLGLLWYYGDNVVARINGEPIRASEMIPSHVGTAEGQLRARGQDIVTQDWMRDLREETVRVIALPRLYEEFGRELGLAFEEDTADQTIIHNVTQAILNDPAVFAQFERYVPEGPTLDEVEAQHASDFGLISQTIEEIAFSIFQRAIAGEDFDYLMETYGEDPGMVANPDGYTFGAWQMVSEFSAGTLALEIGEIGAPVRSQHGWHIIMRVEPDPDNILQDAEIPEEDLLGAKHILIADSSPTIEQVRIEHENAERSRRDHAIQVGFRAMLEDADLTFRRALNRVDIRTTASPEVQIGW